MAKKYVEVFNNGTNDLYITDKEAQDALAAIPSTYATKQELASTGVFDGDTLVL